MAQRQARRRSPRRGATAQLSASRPSGWCASSERSSGPIKAPSVGWLASSATASNRCGPGSSQADIDQGVTPGTTTSRCRAGQGPRAGGPRAEAVERDLASGLGVFRPGGARPPVEVIVGFIDENRDELGVEPICADLQVAPSTYYAAKSRPPSARARPRRRDDSDPARASGRPTTRSMGPTSCGRRPVGPATTSAGTRWRRLMRQAGIRGVRRGRRVITTRRDDQRRPFARSGQAQLHRRATKRACG